ncbi:MAG: hypothetical protein NTX79_02075 [Candidatus Micrarchaeota archaeon]|nr:hypothetical protein [Candidatus Micrarchaeota archaeon]
MKTKQKDVNVTLPIGRIVHGLAGKNQFKALHLLSESVGNLLLATNTDNRKYVNKVFYDNAKKAYTLKVFCNSGHVVSTITGDKINNPVELLLISAEGEPERKVWIEHFEVFGAMVPKSPNEINDSIISALADLAEAVGRRSDYQSVAGKIGTIAEKVTFHFQH